MKYIDRLLTGRVGILTILIRDYILISHFISILVLTSICPLFSIPTPPMLLLITMARLVLIYGMWVRASLFVFWQRYVIYFLLLSISMMEVFFLFAIMQYITMVPFKLWDTSTQSFQQNIINRTYAKQSQEPV